MKHVEERFGPEASKEVLLMCIGITSCVGRLIFGRVADYVQGVNKVYLQVSPGLHTGNSELLRFSRCALQLSEVAVAAAVVQLLTSGSDSRC